MKHVELGAFALAQPLGMTPRAVLGAPRADATDPKAILAALQTSFEEFKKANDEKLKAKVDDVVVTEKVDRINAAVGDFQRALDDLNVLISTRN